MLKSGINTVIRINIDKENFSYINTFLDELYDNFGNFVKRGLLSVDFARVFGYNFSLPISEFYEKRRKLVKKAVKLGFLKPSTENAGIGACCSAETNNLSNLTMDIFGRLYKCWNYVFDNNSYYYDLNALIRNDFKVLKSTQNSINYIEKVSLLNVNNGECLKCKYLPYCRGMCPDMRMRIINGKEENVYKDMKCKSIVETLVKDQIKLIYLNDENNG